MLRNCSSCKKVFAHPNERLCPDCRKIVQEEYLIVKEYLLENPKASMHEVVEKTNVSLERIKEFIKEGKLQTLPSDFQRTCEICHTALSSGRLCEKCRTRLQGGSQAKKTKPQESGKVHFLNESSKRHKE